MAKNYSLIKRFLVVLIGSLLVINQLMIPLPERAYADSGDDVSVLAFTSDVHNDQSNYKGETRLGTWIDEVKASYGKIDVMAFGGDMAQYNSADARFWSETQRVMDVVEAKGVTGYYTTGNHEYDHDSSITDDFYPDKNETTRRYIQNDWAVENGPNYRIYCMGVGEASGYTFVNNAYTANQVSILRNKLSAVDNSKPIFIITHFPLHYTAQNYSGNSRSITRASDVIDTLNNAATGGTPDDPSDDKKIIFLWGHNHSLNSPNDAHYDTIYQKGSSLQYDSSHSKELEFYYAAAGSMSDTEKDAGSGKVEGKGLVATVNGNNQISLTYYKADGTTVTKNGGPFKEMDPVAVENLTIDEASGAGQAGLSVEAGKKLQLSTTVEPADATDNTVTWSSSDTSVATVDENGKVTGVSEGTATITASLTDSVSGDDFAASVIVNVTPRTTSGAPYVLTDTLTPGKNYIIVNANSGSAYALMNNGGAVSKESVTIDGDTIYTDNEDIVFEAQGSGTTINDLHNGNRYLKASSSGLQLLAEAGSSRPWEYDGSNHKLTNYKSSSSTATHYYVYYENGAFAASTSTSASHVVYLFEETELPEDVTYNVTFKVENGEWDDSTSADKTVQVTGPAGTELKLSVDQIPAVGSKPNSGYKEGSWDITPDTTTALTGDVTYTYTYEEQEEPGSEKAYVLTDTLTPGKNYIIVNANSGSAYALMNDNNTVSKEEVTVDGDTIYTDNEDIVFEAQGSGTIINDLHNGNRYLKASSSGLQLLAEAGSSRPWEYDGSNHKLTNYKSSSSTATHYYVYYENGAFAASTSTSASHVVYLFEETSHSHTWDDGEITTQPTCTEKGVRTFTCTVCGETRTEDVDALGHSMEEHAAVAPTCTEAGSSAYWSCDRCNKFFSDEAGLNEVAEDSWVIPATDHKWGEWTTLDDDQHQRVCENDASHVETEDHTWNDGEITTQPTCTAKGVKTYTCSVCGGTKTEDVDALGHNMEEHPAASATCTEAGNSAYYSCDRCNKFFSDEAGLNEVAENSWVIPATDHKWGEWTKLDDDQHQRVCENDASHVEKADHSWDEGTVTTDPTCTAKGVKTYTCSVCGGTKTEDVDALGHNMEEHPAASATCTTAGNSKYYSCDRCHKFFSDEDGETEVEENSWVIPATDHKWGAWTKLDDDQHQRVCENDASHVEKADHIWNDGEITTQPTCTEKGVKTYTCSVCGGTKTEDVDALGHNMEEHATVEATCTTAGNTKYYSCDRCNKFFADEDGKEEIEENSWIVPAKGHNMTPHPAVAATCTDAGNTAYFSCDSCEKSFSDELGLNEIQKDSWVIPATDHKWGEWTKFDDDQHQRVCENDASHVEKADHIWNDGEITTQPTCTEKGVKTYTCSVCGGTKTKDVDALGHNMEEHPAASATCTKAGNSAYYSCDRCNKFFADEDGETKVEENSWVIPATDHKWGEWTKLNDEKHQRVCENDRSHVETEDHTWNDGEITTPATCTAKGVKTFTCSICGGTKTEDVDALGHNMEEHAAVEATCTTAGNSKYYSCDRCHKFFSDEDGETEVEEDSWVIPATDHKWGAWTKLNDEKHQRVCENDRSHVETEDHTWNDGEITTQPTCTEKGVKTYTCSVCGGTKTEDVDALGHNMEEHPAASATCTVAGNSAYYSCDRCEKFFSDELGLNEIQKNSWVIPATDHNWGAWTKLDDDQHQRVCENDRSHVETEDHTWNDGEITTPATCTAKGVKTYTCSVCGGTKTEDVDALGHNMTEHSEAAATCTEAGNSKYFSCDRCEKFFADEDGKEEIEENSWIVPAKGHTWGAVTYTWNDDNSKVTAKRVCVRDDSHVEEETAKTTAKETKAPTTTAEGEMTYTAEFKNEAFDTQTKKVSIPKKDPEPAPTPDPEPAPTPSDDEEARKKAAEEEAKRKAAEEAARKKAAEEAAKKAKYNDVDSITPSDATLKDKAKVSKDLNIKASSISTTAKTKKKIMKVKWKNVKGTTNYIFAFREAGAKNWTENWTKGKNKYVVEKMKKNGLYEFRIMAVKKSGSEWKKSEWSKTNYRFYAKGKQKLKAGKKSVVVKIKKVKKASGYEVLTGLSKKVIKMKVKKFSGNKKTKLKVKGLKTGKKYFVRSRPYKKYNGHKYIGVLNTTAKVKVK